MNDDGTLYTFSSGLEENMNNSRASRWRPSPNFDDISAALTALRATLPSLLGIDEDSISDDAENRIMSLAEGMLQDLGAFQTIFSQD